MEQINRNRLARAILEINQPFGSQPVRKTGEWKWNRSIFYGVNINSPIMRVLWTNFRNKSKEGHFPASDLERIRWEIGLLSEETCAEILKIEEVKQHYAGEGVAD